MTGRSSEARRGVNATQNHEETSASSADPVATSLFGKLFSWLRPSPKPRPNAVFDGGKHIQLTNPWHAVAIAATRNCCQASSDLKRRRFLSGDAPRLPLAACEQPSQCICVYKHFNDRRAGYRRAAEQDASDRPYAPRRPPSAQLQERRRSMGRRATDGH